MKVTFRLKYGNIRGLQRAEFIFRNQIRAALESIGKRLRTSGIARMRKATKESARSLKIEVRTNGPVMGVTVYSTLIQAFIDAEGLRKGTFANFRKGSRLYAWAERHYGKERSKAQRVYNFKRGRPRRKLPGRFEAKAVKQRVKPINQKGRQKLRDANVRRFAYMAARAIYDKGIKPTHWNTEALKANRNRILLELNNGIKRAVNQINRGG